MTRRHSPPGFGWPQGHSRTWPPGTKIMTSRRKPSWWQRLAHTAPCFWCLNLAVEDRNICKFCQRKNIQMSKLVYVMCPLINYFLNIHVNIESKEHKLQHLQSDLLFVIQKIPCILLNGNYDQFILLRILPECQ